MDLIYNRSRTIEQSNDATIRMSYNMIEKIRDGKIKKKGKVKTNMCF